MRLVDAFVDHRGRKSHISLLISPQREMKRQESSSAKGSPKVELGSFLKRYPIE